MEVGGDDQGLAQALLGTTHREPGGVVQEGQPTLEESQRLGRHRRSRGRSVVAWVDDRHAADSPASLDVSVRASLSARVRPWESRSWISKKVSSVPSSCSDQRTVPSGAARSCPVTRTRSPTHRAVPMQIRPAPSFAAAWRAEDWSSCVPTRFRARTAVAATTFTSLRLDRAVVRASARRSSPK